MSNPSYEQAVTSWAAHLRDGGTTAWDRFRDEVVPAAAPGVRPLPDGVHLELVRRLNLASGGVAHPGLVDHVLATVAPGRGTGRHPAPLARLASPVRHRPHGSGRAAVRGAGAAVRGSPGATASRRTRPTGAAGQGAVAVALAPPVPAARVTRDGGGRASGPARPGPGGERLAPDPRRHRPPDRGDDGRALGGERARRRHPEVEHAVAADADLGRAARPDRRRRHRRTARGRDGRPSARLQAARRRRARGSRGRHPHRRPAARPAGRGPGDG